MTCEWFLDCVFGSQLNSSLDLLLDLLDLLTLVLKIHRFF